MSEPTRIVPLRLPASLKEAVETASREDGTSVNRFVVAAATEKLAARHAAAFFAERRGRADLEAARRILWRQGGQPPASEDKLAP